MARQWLTATRWHGARAPNPNSTSIHLDEISEEERALLLSRYHYYYTSDWDWGLPTLEFFFTGIGVIVIFNAIFRIRGWLAKRSSNNNGSVTLGCLDRLTAAARYAVARQYRVPLFNWYSPALAVIIALAGMWTFLMGLTLSVRPYYWPDPLMGHSPPIATRSGWISIGIMPFMIAFSTKINWVGLLTDTSHEKLQVFHRWTALFMYITSLVHTFPYIIDRIRDGTMEINWSTGTFYWTGVAALIPQTWLIFMSWGPIRNRYYEFFKKLHLLAAVVFMAFLFIHVNGMLNSWDYFAATFALYFLSFLVRNLKALYNSSFGLGHPASLQTLPDNMLKANITTPSRIKWAAGQHFIIRFLGLGAHTFSSHPFTVASIPATDGGKNDLELIFAVREGVTKRLRDTIKGEPSKVFRVWVDGPYGGPPVSVSRYDHVYLMAGGSGVTFTLSLLRDLVRRMSNEEKIRCRHIEFILAVKSTDTLSWMDDDLVVARNHGIIIRLYVTQDPRAYDLKTGGSDVESLGDKSKEAASHTTSLGRPNIPAIVHQACRTEIGSIAIAACGPESFLYDLRTAVADCQLAIADGYGTCNDLYLHAETYNW